MATCFCPVSFSKICPVLGKPSVVLRHTGSAERTWLLPRFFGLVLWWLRIISLYWVQELNLLTWRLSARLATKAAWKSPARTTAAVSCINVQAPECSSNRRSLFCQKDLSCHRFYSRRKKMMSIFEDVKSKTSMMQDYAAIFARRLLFWTQRRLQTFPNARWSVLSWLKRILLLGKFVPLKSIVRMDVPASTISVRSSLMSKSLFLFGTWTTRKELQCR